MTTHGSVAARSATTTAGSTAVLILGPHGYRHSRDRHPNTRETGCEGKTDLIGPQALPEVTADLRKIAEQSGISGPGQKTIVDGRKRLVRGEITLHKATYDEDRHRQSPTRGLQTRELADRRAVHTHPHRGGSGLDLSLAWNSTSRLKGVLGTAHVSDKQFGERQAPRLRYDPSPRPRGRSWPRLGWAGPGRLRSRCAGGPELRPPEAKPR